MRLRKRNETSYRVAARIPPDRINKLWGNGDLLRELVTKNALIKVRTMREITATSKTLTGRGHRRKKTALLFRFFLYLNGYTKKLCFCFALI